MWLKIEIVMKNIRKKKRRFAIYWPGLAANIVEKPGWKLLTDYDMMDNNSLSLVWKKKKKNTITYKQDKRTNEQTSKQKKHTNKQTNKYKIITMIRKKGFKCKRSRKDSIHCRKGFFPFKEICYKSLDNLGLFECSLNFRTSGFPYKGTLAIS